MPEVIKEKSLVLNDLYARHKDRIDALMKKYPTRKSAMLPILWVVQEEDGWIAPELIGEVAGLCECTTAEVNEVVSFYQMYNRKPVGKYVLGICGTLPCALCGADGLYAYLSEKLDIKYDGVSEDGLFTIQRRECLGACSESPVMLVNRKLETRLTREKIDVILDECRSGKREPYFTERSSADQSTNLSKTGD